MHSNLHQPAIDAILDHGWIRDVQWYAEIDSTNLAARRALFKSTLDHSTLPLLFVADRQTSGRGRYQRQWWSPEGCLMLTLAVSSHSLLNRPEEWSQLALVSGLAVANAVARFANSVEVQLKWPNDVYLAGKKIAGILIESDAKVWLIGIGLNVCMDWSSAPSEIASKATCVSTACGRRVNSKVVLVELMEELQRSLEGWRSGNLDWQTAWRERCLLTGRVIHVQGAEAKGIAGVCEGIDSQGRLIVRDEHRVHFLTAGEVLAFR